VKRATKAARFMDQKASSKALEGIYKRHSDKAGRKRPAFFAAGQCPGAESSPKGAAQAPDRPDGLALW